MFGLVPSSPPGRTSTRSAPLNGAVWAVLAASYPPRTCRLRMSRTGIGAGSVKTGPAHSAPRLRSGADPANVNVLTILDAESAALVVEHAQFRH